MLALSRQRTSAVADWRMLLGARRFAASRCGFAPAALTLGFRGCRQRSATYHGILVARQRLRGPRVYLPTLQ